MSKSESNRHLAGLDRGNAAKILSAVTMLSASLGMSPAVAAEAPDDPALRASNQHKLESNLQNLESNQHKIESRLQNLESNQYKVESRLQNLESNQHKIESKLQNLESNQHKIESDQRNVDPSGLGQ